MLRRLFLAAALCVLPLASFAQQAHPPALPGHLLSPPSASTEPPFAPLPLPSSGETGSAVSLPSEIQSSAGTANDRGTEQVPLAVRIMPLPPSDAEKAAAIQQRRDHAANDLWMVALSGAVIGLTLLQLVTVITMIVTTRRQLRAYVFVSRAEIVDLDAGMPIVQVDIRNTGQTPAYNVTHVWRCGSFPYPLTEKLPLPREAEPIAWAHLGPGAMVRVHRTADRLLTYGNAERSNRPLAFYVYGEIAYRDAFRKIRTTRYVFFHEGLPRIGPGHLMAHQRGNEAS
jgi:hypothetical protein